MKKLNVITKSLNSLIAVKTDVSDATRFLSSSSAVPLATIGDSFDSLSFFGFGTTIAVITSPTFVKVMLMSELSKCADNCEINIDFKLKVNTKIKNKYYVFREKNFLMRCHQVNLTGLSASSCACNALTLSI